MAIGMKQGGFYGGGGKNDTLPPLLENFMAKRELENIKLYANKMQEPKANDLAGAIWVYGDHEPENINDGIKINLTKDECVSQTISPMIRSSSKTLNDIPSSNASIETIVYLQETDSQFYPYILLDKNYNGTGNALLLRKNCYTQAQYNSISPITNYNGSSLDNLCQNSFIKRLPDLVKNKLVKVDIKSKDVTINRSIFCLSGTEYGYRFSLVEGSAQPYFSADNKRISSYRGAPTTYWTRTLNVNNTTAVATNLSGSNVSYDVKIKQSVRPAIVLSLDFELESTPLEDGGWKMKTPPIPKGENKIENLPVGSKIKVKVKPEFQNLLGEWIKYIIVSQGHPDFPSNTTTLLTEKSIGILSIDAKEPQNTNTQRKTFGSNRYKVSNIRQWLNSQSREWFIPQTSTDTPPSSQYVIDPSAWDTYPGFLYMLDDRFVNAMKLTNVKTMLNSVDGSGTDTMTDKTFLLSASEVGLDSEDQNEGSILTYFENNPKTCGLTQTAIDNGKYSNLPTDTESPWCWFLRTPSSNDAGRTKEVSKTGTISEDLCATVRIGIRSATNISRYNYVSDEVDADGYYEMTYEPQKDKVIKDISWSSNKDFFARQFTYNPKKQYQTMLEGAITSSLVEGAPPQVTDFNISGNGANPILTWKNPIESPIYKETVIIQKEGSAPNNITDGIEIYRGTNETTVAKNLKQSIDYYFAAYTVNVLGFHRDPVVSSAYHYNISPVLNDNSWNVISEVAKSGQGANYWKIGDCKEIHIKGTIIGQEFDTILNCFIIGFNHNELIEGKGIHFQIGKSKESPFTDIALIDEKYDLATSYPTFHMNQKQTSLGGWKDCYMRNTICQDFYKCLPQDLQLIIKECTKYTDNGSAASAQMTPTTDKIWLLSEYEVNGINKEATSRESEYQKQYAYYKVGNSTIKYKHNSISNAAKWYLRSREANNTDYYCAMNTTDKKVWTNTATRSAGLAPCFML